MPRVQARTVAEHRRLVLDRVYRSFTSLVGERGYDAVTLADITKAAGLARTAIYHYFPDKETLLLAYTAHLTDAFLSDLRAELFRLEDPLHRLDAYVRAQLTYAARHQPPVMPPLHSVLSADGSRQIHRYAEILREMLAAILTDAAAAGQLPQAVADDPHTARLVLACLTSGPPPGGTSGPPPDADSPEFAATVAGTQAFVRRAVGAAPAGADPASG